MGFLDIHDSWVEKAACSKLSMTSYDRAEYMFPPPRARGDIDRAKKVCENCIVREECLAFALKTGEKIGIWGGKTESERLKIMRKHNRVLLSNAVCES